MLEFILHSPFIWTLIALGTIYIISRFKTDGTKERLGQSSSKVKASQWVKNDYIYPNSTKRNTETIDTNDTTRIIADKTSVDKGGDPNVYEVKKKEPKKKK